ncbi:unnamed protein product, partial [Iphiclides podalirius]
MKRQEKESKTKNKKKTAKRNKQTKKNRNDREEEDSEERDVTQFDEDSEDDELMDHVSPDSADAESLTPPRTTPVCSALLGGRAPSRTPPPPPLPIPYLGVVFDSKLGFSQHLNRVKNRATFVLGRLYPLEQVIISVLVNAASGGDFRKFPHGFKFGASTSAYQVEGGWNASDKGESIWDRTVHTDPVYLRRNISGDVAADSYHKWRQDIAIASDLGLHFYRFSLSWTRLLPTGFTNVRSEDGKKYYNNLIDGLLEKGIEPVVTLYHWDLPQTIQDLGGWTNPLISDWFAEYARYAFEAFGDRVKTWTTINEPLVVCDFIYNSGVFAPGVKETIYGPYLCNKHVLIAHAKAYRVYDGYFREKQQGKISISNNLLWLEPLNPEDEALAELGREHCTGRYSHPIFSKKGGWPPLVEKAMAEYSLKQGFNTSRLPAFTKEEIKLIRGTYDFYALNHYTTRFIRPVKPGEDPGFWFVSGSPEIGAVLEADPAWSFGASQLLPVYPEGLRRQIAWLMKKYGNVGFLITENGYSTAGSELNDVKRIKFIKDYLEQLLLSIWVDGAKVLGYTYWSMIDNLEWADGYDFKFGLYEVDYDSPERTRTPRASAHYYSNVIRTNTIYCEGSTNGRRQPMRYRRKGPENSSHNVAGSVALISIAFAFLV